MKKYFPNKQMYPIYGNHECFPTDNCGFDKKNWLTVQLGQYWKDFIGPEGSQSFIDYGYYSVFNTKFNFRLIATDNNVCDLNNFHLIKNPTDPKGQV